MRFADVHSTPKSTEIRKNRALEKQRVNYDNRIAARMEQYQEPESLPESNIVQIPVHSEAEAIPLCTILDPNDAGTLMLGLD